jgi:hypothetical protein
MWLLTRDKEDRPGYQLDRVIACAASADDDANFTSTLPSAALADSDFATRAG